MIQRSNKHFELYIAHILCVSCIRINDIMRPAMLMISTRSVVCVGMAAMGNKETLFVMLVDCAKQSKVYSS